MHTINKTLDDVYFERRKALGVPWREVIEAGLEVLEAERDELEKEVEGAAKK